VDVAWVTYPFRANENQGVLLVNGDPSPIDVDDFSRLAQGELNRDQAYAELKRAYPDISLWPGDRYSFDVPIAESLPSGGSRFHVGYILRNGCHACDKIGSAVFAFDFTPEGKFSGTKLMVVTDTVGKGFTDPTEPLVVKPGREFSLTLAVNPSTGYGWTVAGPLEQSVVKQIRTEYRHPSAKAPGAGGAEILRFKAVGKGKTVISLSYARPWEQGGEPARRVAFVIIVQ
jgi:predicted secreted protein